MSTTPNPAIKAVVSGTALRQMCNYVAIAETFAIPEFRTIGSGATKVCSKMLGLLAAYKDFPEETAVRLLSNDLLIDNLQATQDDEKFQAQVESAIASENQVLLEEWAALSRRIEWRCPRNDTKRMQTPARRNALSGSQIRKFV